MHTYVLNTMIQLIQYIGDWRGSWRILLVHMLCIKITLIINMTCMYYEWSSSSLLGVEFRVPLTGEGLGWALCRAGELESIVSGPPCDAVTFNTLHQHTQGKESERIRQQVLLDVRLCQVSV